MEHSGRTGLYARRTLALVAVLALWQAGVSVLHWINPFYLPAPSAIAATLYKLFADGSIYTHPF